MKKATLISAILILTTSFALFAGNSKLTTDMKSTEINTLVNSELNNDIKVSFTQKNDVKINIDNNISYLEKYQLQKSASSKSRLHNVQNFLKNPEQRKITNKVILC